MAVRVYIGTTEGPAEIQRITPEDPKVRSVICLDGKTIALPVARDYDSFVREPTGVIQMCFGHPAYRVDVSAPISSGNSWQLGVFAAHALLAQNRLAQQDAAADRAIWLTGEVDRDLDVGPVDHVDEKISRSKELFASLKRDDIPLTIYMARDNAEILTDEWITHRGIDPAQCRVVALDDIDALCRDLALTSPKSRVEKRRGAQIRPRRIPRTRAVAISIALAAICMIFGLFALQSGFLTWIDLHRSARFTQLNEQLDGAATGDCLTCGAFARVFRFWLDYRRPHEETIELLISERRARDGRLCPTEGGGQGALESVPVAKDANGQLKPSNVTGLCALVFNVTKSGRPAYVWAFAQIVPDRTYIFADRDTLNVAREPVAGPRSWSVRPPENIARPLQYQFVALSSQDPLTASVEWMLRRLFQNRSRPYAADWVAVVRELNGRGITVVSVWHKLTP